MLKNLLEAATIPELIEYAKNLKISHAGLYLKGAHTTEDNDIIVINTFSLLNKYHDFIKANSSPLTFTDKELKEYIYQPKRLSMKLYGTTELWSLLLRVNNITSILDFKKTSIIAPQPGTIKSILNEIIIIETNTIENNAETIPNE